MTKYKITWFRTFSKVKFIDSYIFSPGKLLMSISPNQLDQSSGLRSLRHLSHFQLTDKFWNCCAFSNTLSFDIFDTIFDPIYLVWTCIYKIRNFNFELINIKLFIISYVLFALFNYYTWYKHRMNYLLSVKMSQ